MRTWWVVSIGLVLCAVTAAAAPRAELDVPVARNVRALLDRDHAIYLSVLPHDGDAWSRLALRITGKSSNWKTLAEMNGQGENLLTDRPVRVPLSLVKPELQQQALQALFPADRQSDAGWVHKVVLEGAGEGESLWKIAEWFTGDGANYSEIRRANGMVRLSTRKGDLVKVPASLLTAGLRRNGRAVARIQEAEDDPSENGHGRTPVERASLAPAPDARSTALEYRSEGGQPYALYRLQRGEALYSSVAIRFTGRVYAKDVYEVVDRIVAFNRIDDVSKMPAGYPVKIPMELLLPEYRPQNDPRRMAEEESKRESARVAKRARARDLRGVHVIIDPGHGGRDVGTSHDGLYEADYVYDVASRLKALLEKKTGAKVWMTTRSSEREYEIPSRNVLPRMDDHEVLTSPAYDLDDPVVGVHLRWYLANSILARALSRNVPREKVVFISIHADSLHPSLRGAMAYIPGQRYVQGSFSKKGSVYLARSEVRENPTVTQSEEEALLAEGLSREFAESLIGAFARKDLAVHPFKPVRDNVVRNGREWVPAVIRFNKVPTRVLLEICNLANEEDRSLVRTRQYRQAVAEALRDGIVRFFSQQEAGPAPKVASKNSK